MEEKNGNKYITPRVFGLFIVIAIAAFGFVYGLASSAYQTGQDNRVDISAIQANIANIDKNVEILLNR